MYVRSNIVKSFEMQVILQMCSHENCISTVFLIRVIIQSFINQIKNATDLKSNMTSSKFPPIPPIYLVSHYNTTVS